MFTRASILLLIVLTATSVAEGQITIMPLGDSITWGFNGSKADPASPGGYRDALYTDLKKDGQIVQFVGASNANSSALLRAKRDTEQNGYLGYTINQVDDNLNGFNAGPNPIDPYTSNEGGYWLTGGHGTGRGAETADFILLHIGTNDLLSNADPLYKPDPTDASAESTALFTAHVTLRMDNLLTNLRALEPKATILVAGLIPDGLVDNRVIQFNRDVQHLISTSFSGTSVEYVDMYNPLDNNAYYSALYGSSPDGVHPNSAGYSQMAQVWTHAIRQSEIPEPSTVCLVVLGVMLLAWRVRQGRQ